MHYNKTQIVLFIYEQFIDKGMVQPDEIKQKFSLEERTFLRYIAEVRAYLYNFYKGFDIYYIRSQGIYKYIGYTKEVA
ncbi:MAG: hypothetical protein NC090_03105 [Anaeroplasma bactoclasticum]|nr:hypothetical protein [Anaeroplasma bactoclasticum]